MDQDSRHILLNNQQMAKADGLTIEGGVTGSALMENAGRAVAEEIMKIREPARAAILCGPGNNGGDGFVIARHLKEKGWTVRIGLLGELAALKGDAAAKAAEWGEGVRPLSPDLLTDAGVIVDALFGTGLSRPIDGRAAEIIAAANRSNALRIAVDIPSGISGNSGEALGEAFSAYMTVTFFRKKWGHVLAPGRFYCGRIMVRDIGISNETLTALKPRTFENAPAFWLESFPRPDPLGHKYHRGHTLAVSGGMTSTGAIRLAAQAALRIGSGLVTIAAPPDALPAHAAHLTSIMLTALAGEADFTGLLKDQRMNTLLLGPANGVGPLTRDRVLAALATGRNTVLDADAISVFEKDENTLFKAVRGPTVMTPHGGEFARLFPALVKSGDKISVTREAARRSGAVIVYKGPDTTIASPEGAAVVNTNAPPGLATAGSGDVLAGMIAGLLAQGMPPMDAAAAAVWIHGEAAKRFGPGLISEDIIAGIPDVLCDLLK